MWDDTAKLIRVNVVRYDKYGNEVTETKSREVFVQPRGVYHSEFYEAAQHGLSPSVTFLLSIRDDYHGEKLIEWHGAQYKVIRVDWTAQKDGVALICEERINNEDGVRADE